MDYPWAIQLPGPPEKVGFANVTLRLGTGAVVHSAEGSAAGAWAVLTGPHQVSWHFTALKDGTVWQHYDTGQICWHAGSKANPYYIAIECEGLAGEELTPVQADSLSELLRWLHESYGWPAAERHVTLFEHNEFMATACPSGRIPWPYILNALQPPPSEPGPPDRSSSPAESSDASAAAAVANSPLFIALVEALLTLWRDDNLDLLDPAASALIIEACSP